MSNKKKITLLNYKHINMANVEYSNPINAKNSIKIIAMSYNIDKNINCPLFFEIKNLITTSGIVNLQDKFYIDIKLDILSSKRELFDFIINFDNRNIIVCAENTQEWFGTKMPRQIIQDYYKSPIKYDSEGNPFIRIPLPTINGKLYTEIYDNYKNKTNYDVVLENDTVDIILCLEGLKFTKTTAEPIWEVRQLKVYRNILNKLDTYAFADDDGPEDNDAKPSPQKQGGDATIKPEESKEPEAAKDEKEGKEPKEMADETSHEEIPMGDKIDTPLADNNIDFTIVGNEVKDKNESNKIDVSKATDDKPVSGSENPSSDNVEMKETDIQSVGESSNDVVAIDGEKDMGAINSNISAKEYMKMVENYDDGNNNGEYFSDSEYELDDIDEETMEIDPSMIYKNDEDTQKKKELERLRMEIEKLERELKHK